MNPESPKTPESKFPKYEELSGAQREMLLGWCDVKSAEDFESLINGEWEIGGDHYPFTAEEIVEQLKQALENEQ